MKHDTPKDTIQPDPDAHLSDHQWRMKMAAEGKALYVSGRDTDELRATLQKKQAVGLETVSGGWNVINRQTGEAHFVADKSQTSIRTKAARTGPVIVPQRPIPFHRLRHGNRRRRRGTIKRKHQNNRNRQ